MLAVLDGTAITIALIGLGTAAINAWVMVRCKQIEADARADERRADHHATRAEKAAERATNGHGKRRKKPPHPCE